jgi:two-component system OmpR family sensor kinase
VRLYRQDGGVVLEVADEGPGMSGQDAAMAFNRFYRGGHTARQPEDGGTPGSGLGLAIVQAIAVAHGGHARLSSAPGRGTAVQLWIPPERILATPPAPARSGR